MGTISNQIIGACRFSFPSLGGFAGRRLDPEDLENQLFAPARIEARFRYFETLTLPSLAAQSDPGFRLVVLIGRGLQMRYKTRLRELADQYPFVVISQQDPSGPLVSTRRAFRKGLREDSGFVTGFRIDDDDAVAHDYIARTRAAADVLLREGMADAENPAVIAFHRGLYWDLKMPEQPFYDVRERMPLGLAAAMIAPVDAQENIFRWNHRHLAARVRTWADPTDQMFLRTLHRSNDSNGSIPPGAEPISIPDAKSLLADRFGIDPDAAMGLMG